MVPRYATVLALALPLTACGSMTVRDFEGESPRFALEDYFQGTTKAHGIFRDRFGDVRRRFAVDVEGEWDAESRTLTLDEDFRYADGETDNRVWTIEKTGPHSYVGTAGDVVGEAEGKAYGPAFTWSYTLKLPVADSTWRVHVEDWMFRQSEGVVLNTASVSKWGFEVGTLTIAFHKPGARAAAVPVPGELAAGPEMAAESP